MNKGSPANESPDATDQNLARAHEWMHQFLTVEDWRERYARIETEVVRMTTVRSAVGPIAFRQDSVDWYLYLLDRYVEAPDQVEINQASRILPVFEAIGRNLGILKRMRGAGERMRRLFKHPHADADGAFFELLIAAGYERTGASAELLAESGKGKTPDLRVRLSELQLYVECKRLSRRSERELNEVAKWRKLWAPMKALLFERRLWLLLDIDIKADILELPDDFIVQRLAPLAVNPVVEGQWIDDDKWSVRASRIAADVVLRTFNVDRMIMCGSAAERAELCGGYFPTRGCSTGIVGQQTRKIGSSGPFGNYWDRIDLASAALWSCSSEASVVARARDVRKQLAEAVRQIPNGEVGAIHVGVECMNTSDVEGVRRQRLERTLRTFDLGNADVRSISLHLFTPELPPDKNWDYGEEILWRQHGERTWPTIRAVGPE